MDQTTFKERLKEIGLENYFQSFQPFFKNTIRLYPQEADENGIAIGQTKIGGFPDLPPEITWPNESLTNVITETKFFFFISKREESVSIPLSFIAQLNLREISPLDEDNLLPKSGMLYFFYSTEDYGWVGDQSDRSKFIVLYWDGDHSVLQRTDLPHNDHDVTPFKAAAVSIRQEISLPPLEHDVYDTMPEKDQDAFFDELSPYETINKVLGYSDNIQGEMELDTELITNGLYTAYSADYNSPGAKFLAPNANDWQLLIQIDSNEQNEMSWGDSGRLYFWIKKQDLLQKKFDNCWCWMQCS